MSSRNVSDDFFLCVRERSVKNEDQLSLPCKTQATVPIAISACLILDFHNYVHLISLSPGSVRSSTRPP